MKEIISFENQIENGKDCLKAQVTVLGRNRPIALSRVSPLEGQEEFIDNIRGKVSFSRVDGSGSSRFAERCEP